MYITEVKEKVEQILEQRNGVEIYFVLKKNESRIVRSVNIADELDTSDTTSEEMLNGFVTVIENTFSSYNDSDEVLKLSSADERKNALYYYDSLSVFIGKHTNGMTYVAKNDKFS